MWVLQAQKGRDGQFYLVRRLKKVSIKMVSLQFSFAKIWQLLGRQKQSGHSTQRRIHEQNCGTKEQPGTAQSPYNLQRLQGRMGRRRGQLGVREQYVLP